REVRDSHRRSRGIRERGIDEAARETDRREKEEVFLHVKIGLDDVDVAIRADDTSQEKKERTEVHDVVVVGRSIPPNAGFHAETRDDRSDEEEAGYGEGGEGMAPSKLACVDADESTEAGDVGGEGSESNEGDGVQNSSASAHE